MNTSIAHKLNAAEVAPRFASRAKVDEALLLELARLRASQHLATGEILSRSQFLRQLQREKLRTDRSKSPLSIVLFTCDGDDEAMRQLLDLLLSRKREIDMVGYLDDQLVAVLLPDTNDKGAEGLKEKILRDAVGSKVSATTCTYPDQLFEGLLGDGGVAADLFPIVVGEVSSSGHARRILKRSIDVVGAAVGIVLASPVMAVTAVAVAMSSPGPIIFRQIRLGKGGVPFVFYKFRSMRTDADDRIHREYMAKLIEGDTAAANQGDAAKPLYKLKADPRVTKIGKLIRKTSLDELPQLFNVLRGDMSLVGPRPPVPYEVEKYQSWHLRRILEAQPGITGLWQVEGRSKTTFDEMVRLDLRYVRSKSLLLDVKILFRTVGVVLFGVGGR